MHRATILALLFLFSAAPAAAQVSVAGNRSLAFGFLTRGLTTTVLPTDAVKSGQWNVGAPVGQLLLVHITLPNQLQGPSGATLPVTFDADDALIQGTWAGAAANYFNPAGLGLFRFTGGNQAVVRLGGRASPSTTQRAGAYTNTAVCVIIVL